ncbi:TadE family protein [Cutibacterium modestum]|uniref:TadE family protein n=1 Tax=Cutibacterium modestum TaxID=2559073 RepID=UPI000F047C63|nr:TadE family protein [Cutibacterium modestum]
MRDKVRTDQRGGGSASVGMLLLVPAIMLIAFGGIEIGLWYHAHQSTLAAAQSAAEAQRVVHPDPGSAQEAAERITSHGGVRDTRISVSDDGATVTVTVSGRAPSMLGLHLPAVSSTTSMPKERLS